MAFSLTPGSQDHVAVTVSVILSLKPCPYLPFLKHCMPLPERVARAGPVGRPASGRTSRRTGYGNGKIELDPI